jgi:lysophospholipid acyltransferase (LPLAT)-like uncharacterized protein
VSLELHNRRLKDDQTSATRESSADGGSTVTIAPRRFTLWQRIQLWLISTLATLLIYLIGPTLRFIESYEEGAPQPWNEQLAIWAFWHRCVIPAAWKFRGHQIAVMTSQSYDGEYIARTINHFGFEAIRGSSSRGGREALFGMQQHLGSGRSVAFTIDGPRGPKYVAKPGAVMLARTTQQPVMCFYLAVERAWVLRSWDNFVIPKPFSRVFGRLSAPVTVPPDADAHVMKECQAQVQAALDRATKVAEAAFGREP